MSQKRILLVDDDADQRLSIRLPLEAAGYAIFEAPGYDQGLVAVKEVKPDLIVLDVMMDTTTAGFQFALTLHSPDRGLGVQRIFQNTHHHADRYPQHHTIAFFSG